MTSAKYEYLSSEQRSRIRLALRRANHTRPRSRRPWHVEAARLARLFGVKKTTIIAVWRNDHTPRQARWY